MVSGLVTSPCDQLRIFSGDARLIRMESKSAIKFALSYGEDRYIILLIKTWDWGLGIGGRNSRPRCVIPDPWPRGPASPPPAPYPALRAASSLTPRPGTATATRGSGR